MPKQDNSSEKCSAKAKCGNFSNPCGGSSAIYGLGVVGSIFYFVQTASNFGDGVVGIAKAFFWPAILMYKLLTYLQL